MSFSFIFFIRAFYSIINLKRIKKRYKIPNGELEYSDLNKPNKSLFSKKYQLVGKPDYIIKQKNSFIPVEYKSCRSTKPHNNHILQLAAYCHLVEENYKCFVDKGILVYENKSFEIEYNPNIRFILERTINEIRNQMKKNKIFPNHNDHYKCVNCSYNQQCKFKF